METNEIMNNEEFIEETYENDKGCTGKQLILLAGGACICMLIGAVINKHINRAIEATCKAMKEKKAEEKENDNNEIIEGEVVSE